ncbi:MAG: cadherin domain-containing protein [Opitutales bacterium]
MNRISILLPILSSCLVHGLSANRSSTNYSIGPETFAGLAGDSNSSAYAQFSAVEPLSGLSVKNMPDFKNFAGFIGQLPPLDQDGDGLPDSQEAVLGTDKTLVDTDADGLTDGEEVTLGTNPLVADSDGDGYSDFAEAQASTNPLLASSNPNQAPSSLILSNQTILENQPVGTVIGVITAQDTDANDTLTYQLIPPPGQPNNQTPSAFTLETNGTLLSSLSFDFEQQDQFPVRIRATDSHGSSIQKEFIISVLDVDESTPTTPAPETPSDNNQSEPITPDPDDQNESTSDEHLAEIISTEVLAEVSASESLVIGFSTEGGEIGISVESSSEVTLMDQSDQNGGWSLIATSNLISNQHNDTINSIQTSLPIGTYSLMVMGNGSPKTTSVKLFKTVGSTGKFKLFQTRALSTTSSPLTQNIEIAGNGTAKIFAYAFGGQTLESLGVSNSLNDPELHVYSKPSSGGSWTPTASNDNWVDSPQASDLQSLSPTFGLQSMESGLIANLPKDAHSFQVGGTSYNWEGQTVLSIEFLESSSGQVDDIISDPTLPTSPPADSNETSDTDSELVDHNTTTPTVPEIPGDDKPITDPGSGLVDNDQNQTSEPVQPEPEPLPQVPTFELVENQVSENSPAGSFAGKLLVPDLNGTQTLSFILSEPSPFELKPNGTLLAKRSFDFESDPASLPLTITATNDSNQSLELNFAVTLLNEIEDLDGDGFEDAHDPDIDGDGLSNKDEALAGTDPRIEDSDEDELSDGEEIALKTNPLSDDSDQDGLSDGTEIGIGTNPLTKDTDGDGFNDQEEVLAGSFPEDANDYPGKQVVVERDPNEGPDGLLYQLSEEKFTLEEAINYAAQEKAVIPFLTVSTAHSKKDPLEIFLVQFMARNSSLKNPKAWVLGETQDFFGFERKTILTQRGSRFAFIGNRKLQVLLGYEKPPVRIPYLKTLAAEIDGNKVRASGELMDDGGEKPFRSGFRISEKILVQENDPTARIVSASLKDNVLEAVVERLEPGKTYYLRAFAENSAGVSYGAFKRIKLTESYDAPFAGKPEGQGWFRSDWFGLFLPANENWVFHQDFEWIYHGPTNQNGIWFWSERIGWSWTREDVWPYLWMNNQSNWTYYFGKKGGQPTFWDYSNQSVFRWRNPVSWVGSNDSLPQ